MIFVTVGTTHFNSLIIEIDKLAEAGNIKSKIICQIGSGEYIPKHCEYFRMKRSIDSYIQTASLVISHGGATVLALLANQTKFIAIANTDLPGDHQTFFLARIAQDSNILWSRNVNDVGKLITISETQPPAHLNALPLGIDLRRTIQQRFNKN